MVLRASGFCLFAVKSKAGPCSPVQLCLFQTTSSVPKADEEVAASSALPCRHLILCDSRSKPRALCIPRARFCGVASPAPGPDSGGRFVRPLTWQMRGSTGRPGEMSQSTAWPGRIACSREFLLVD